MPSTAADLITEQALGDLVDHRTFSLIGVTEPLALARNKVREALTGRADEGKVDDAVLVIGELVANAVQHAGGPVSMDLDLYEKGATVRVADRGTDVADIPAAPVSPLAHMEFSEITLDLLPEGGQGLYLVSAIAAAWCVEAADVGKVVTAAFQLVGGDA